MAATYATPPSRIRKLRNVDSPISSVGLLLDNDDLEERRLRRRSKILTNNILSPGGVQASPARGLDKDKRKSLALSNNGMSNAQIKEHYTNCIKLSSENKINAKNAFGLHLIDYMKDLLRQAQKEESGTNFQIASCTLDAGVKIYAYRVDSVHSEAYKVLGSLGRAVDNPEHNENNEVDGNVEDGEIQQKQVRQKKKYTGKTIETNLRNINCEQYDLDSEIDPFFHKISAAFDEGGTAGLLSYQLHSRSNNNDLMMDSSVKFSSFPVKLAEERSSEEQDIKMVPITQLKELYKRISIDSKEICPQFKSFHFNGWDKDSQEIGGNVFLPDDSFNDNVHRFDINAPVLPDPSDTFDTGGGDGGDFDGFADRTTTENDFGPIQFDGTPAQRVDALSNAGTNGSVSTVLALSLQPSEYSYFNQDYMSMWAGPLHWKIKPLSKEKSSTTSTATKSVTKKIQVFIDFDKDIDMKKVFGTGRGATYLKDSTIEKHATQLTVLPPDLHYKAETLFTIFIRENISIKRQAVAKQVETEDENWYDYDNKNDREGFCPIVSDDDGGGYDDDDLGCSRGDDMSYMQPTQQPLILENGTFAGDNLVAPPDKVRVTDINYAKAAKRIDVKKLKTTMWKILCENQNDEKENAANQNNLPKPALDIVEDSTEKDNVSGLYTFKSMYKALPCRVSQNMAKNLSGPIAFVCLLYLANEKTLKLSGTDDMGDIIIEEGI